MALILTNTSALISLQNYRSGDASGDDSGTPGGITLTEPPRQELSLFQGRNSDVAGLNALWDSPGFGGSTLAVAQNMTARIGDALNAAKATIQQDANPEDQREALIDDLAGLREAIADGAGSPLSGSIGLLGGDGIVNATDETEETPLFGVDVSTLESTFTGKTRPGPGPDLPDIGDSLFRFEDFGSGGPDPLLPSPDGTSSLLDGGREFRLEVSATLPSQDEIDHALLDQARLAEMKSGPALLIDTADTDGLTRLQSLPMREEWEGELLTITHQAPYNLQTLFG